MRRAICGDAFRCALAQHFANKTGYVASVTGQQVDLYLTKRAGEMGDKPPVATAKLGGHFSTFVSNYDNHEYKFLGDKDE